MILKSNSPSNRSRLAPPVRIEMYNPPPSGDGSYWEPGFLEAMILVGLLIAYWTGWLGALWPF